MAQYTIDIRVNASGAVSGGRTATRSLNEVDAAARETQKDLDVLSGAARNSGSAFDRMSAAVKGLATALAADKVIEYADAWATVNNRLANSRKANEDLADVTERVFAVAQESRGQLEATATLYGRLEAATRGQISSGAELASVVETINKAYIVSGATAAEMRGSIIQLSQAFGAGALRSEEFNSVNEAAPRIMQAIADTMGVTRGELKALAAQGEITTEVMIKAFQQQSAKIDAEFDKMKATFEQKGVLALNNLEKAFGENSGLNDSVATLGDLMVSASENATLLIDAATLLSVAYGSKLVGALANATAAKVSNIRATQQEIAAEVEAASAAVAEASAKERQAAATLANRQALVSTQLVTAANTKATRDLAAAEAEYTIATNAATAASERLAVAQRVQAASSTAAGLAAAGARGALALIGGPAGAATLAAIAIYAVYQNMQKGKDEARAYGERISDVAKNLRDMTSAQLEATRAEASGYLKQNAEDAEDLRDKLADLQAAEGRLQAKMQLTGTSAGNQAQNQRLLTENLREQAVVKRDLEALDAKAAQAQGLVAQATRELGREASITSIGLQVVTDAIRGMSPAAEGYSESAQQVIDKLKAELDSLTGNANALTLYQNIQRAGVDLDSEAGEEIAALTEKIAARKKAIEDETKSQKDSNTEIEKRKRLLIETRQLIESQIQAQRDAVAGAASAARPGRDSGDYGAALEQYNQQKALNEQRYSEGLLSEQQYQAARFGIEQQAEQDLAEMRKKYADDNAKAEQERISLLVTSTSTVAGLLGDITSAMSDAGKDQTLAYKVLFAAQKAAAIPAIITAAETGAAQALALGPIGIPISAAIKALGYASAGVVAGQGIAGFADGGYVSGAGTGRSDSILAALSNGEFVVNAAQTRKNRSTLEAIHAGKNVSTSGGAQAVQNNVYNYASGVQVETRPNDTGGTDTYIKRSELDKLVAKNVANGYSKTSKSLRNNTTASRKL